MQEGFEFLNILSYKWFPSSKSRFTSSHGHSEITPGIQAIHGQFRSTMHVSSRHGTPSFKSFGRTESGRFVVFRKRHIHRFDSGGIFGTFADGMCTPSQISFSPLFLKPGIKRKQFFERQVSKERNFSKARYQKKAIFRKPGIKRKQFFESQVSKESNFSKARYQKKAIFRKPGIKRKKFFESQLSTVLFHCFPVNFLRFGVYFFFLKPAIIRRKIPKLSEQIIPRVHTPVKLNCQVLPPPLACVQKF